MASANEWAQKAKEYSGYASAGADKFLEFQENAQKLKDAGATLNEFQDFAVGMKWASKVGMALGAASIGLTVIAALLPVDTIEDKILRGVTELKQQIDELRDHLDVKIRRQELTLDLSAVKRLLDHDTFSSITTAQNFLQSAAARRADPSTGEAAVIEDAFMRSKVDMMYALTQIESALTASEHENILWLTSEVHYGDPRKLIEIGYTLQMMATLAVAAYCARGVLAARIEHGGKDRVLPKERELEIMETLAGRPEISSDPAAILGRIVDMVQAAVDRCLEREVREAYVTSYFDDSVKTIVHNIMSLRQGSAESAVDLMHTQFPYLNFTALVYDGVVGQDHHGWRGSGPDYGLIVRRNWPLAGYEKDDDAYNKRNLILYFGPRLSKTIPKTQTLPNLPKPSPTRKVAAEAISTYLNIKKDDGLFDTDWQRVRLRTGTVHDLIEMNYSSTVYPKDPSDWENDFVWAGFTHHTIGPVIFPEKIGPIASGFTEESKEASTQKGIGLFLGIASQNRIGIVTKADWTEHLVGFDKRVASIKPYPHYYQVVVIWDDAH